LRSLGDFLYPLEDGLWEYTAGVWLQHRHDGPHPVENYKALDCDGQGRLWAASGTKGWRLELLSGGSWSVFTPDDDIFSNTWIWDLRADEEGLWVGHCCCKELTAACNLNHWVLGDSLATVFEVPFNVWDSAEDVHGNLWFASYFERAEEFPDAALGLFHLNRQTQVWTHYDIETTAGLLHSNVVTAVAADERYLWIGHAGEGLTRARLDSRGLPYLNEGAWTHYNADDVGSTLAGNRIAALATRSGQLWIGTDNGVSLRHDNGWDIYREHFAGLPGSEVRDIALTEDGAAWIAIGGKGVTRMTPQPDGGYAFERFGPPDLVSPDVLCLTPGAGRRDVWVGTSAGLSHYIPRAELPAEQFTEVPVYPNPYNPACGEPLRFADLPGRADRGLVVDVSGRILETFSGKWVGDAFWDGRDPDGEAVAPGLYVVRVATPQGWLTGRVAVLDLPCD
ncbi:MAG: hypothetical protein GY778_20880, partial [bacterium]|nr:hypothetical protein [bacterium]